MHSADCDKSRSGYIDEAIKREHTRPSLYRSRVTIIPTHPNGETFTARAGRSGPLLACSSAMHFLGVG